MQKYESCICIKNISKLQKLLIVSKTRHANNSLVNKNFSYLSNKNILFNVAKWKFLTFFKFRMRHKCFIKFRMPSSENAIMKKLNHHWIKLINIYILLDKCIINKSLIKLNHHEHHHWIMKWLKPSWSEDAIIWNDIKFRMRYKISFFQRNHFSFLFTLCLRSAVRNKRMDL